MSKRNAKTDRGLSGQPGLFDMSMPDGIFDILLGLKQLMSREMNGHNRHVVAMQISRLTGRELSKDMLDKYVSSDAAYRPPADALVAFCHVTGSLEVFRYLLEPLGSDVLNPEDRDLIRLARVEEKIRELQAESQHIRAKRGIK